jgi:hypothetical protein
MLLMLDAEKSHIYTEVGFWKGDTTKKIRMNLTSDKIFALIDADLNNI